MSSGDFEARLHQSVQAHREAIAEMAGEAKRRIEMGMPARTAVPPAPPALNDEIEADPFEDAAFASARSGGGPAVRFDDVDDDAAWEDSTF